MRVGVDGRTLREGRSARGVALYLTCLLDRLRETPGDEYRVLTPGRGGLGGRLGYASSALLRRPRLDRRVGGCEVFWAPAPAPLALTPGHPFVLTIHDLSFEHHPRDYTRYERLWHLATRPRALARRADRVIAVSSAVRDQLLGEWGLPEDNVVVVRSGPGRPVAAGEQPPKDLPASYLLAVGALEPRKRVDLLLEAYAVARGRGLEAGLVLAGEGDPGPRAPGVRALGFVPSEQLGALYANALALVSASREEGFGFTPLEALARGTPAVVPNLPPFRETLGEAALRFAPGDAGGLADAMLRLERVPGLRQRLVAASAGPLAELSWERAARQTRAVLEELT